MLIGKDWKIESDHFNITLYKRHRVAAKDGKLAHDNWVSEGYYSTVANALKDMVNIGIRETDMKDLKTIAKKIDELYALFDTRAPTIGKKDTETEE